jgi:hypothetical protein
MTISSKSGEIVERRIRAQLGAGLKVISPSDKPGDFAFGIVQITKNQGPCGASLNTGRLIPRLQPMFTGIALLHGPWLPLAITLGFVGRKLITTVSPSILREKANLIGTSHDASPATYALILINEHQVVFFSLMAGAGRTDGHAGRLVAMIAADRQEYSSRGRIGSLFFFQHSHPEHTGGRAILGFARYGATLTADAPL